MKTCIAILLLASTISINAQNKDEVLKKIESAKIALITERLNLSPEQAQEFWPIYNEYYNRQKEIRLEYNQVRKTVDPKSASEEQSKRLLELGMKVKENQLVLDKEYSGRMMNVISSRQMVELRKAESDFRKMLVERVRSNNQQRQNMKDRLKNNERLRQQRNN